MRVIYQAARYSPDLVTGVYVRCEGSKRHGYRFRVYEAATGEGRHFGGKPGHGPTLREYETDGAEIPDDVKAKAIRSKQTELWEYRA